jgi:general secretion pathway protein I
MKRDGYARRGFTLLEVMVSLSILALALVAIGGVSAGAFEQSNYAKQITVATLLARSKMIDVEELLRKDGFGDDEKTFDGDFDKEGYPGLKWRAVARPIEVDVAQLIGGLFGGEVDTEQLPGKIQDFLGGVRGEGPDQLVDSISGSDLSKVLGGGGLELILKQVGDTLSKSIREITVEIIWKEGEKFEDSVKFVQYVTTTGRLAVPSGVVQIPAQGGLPTAPGHRQLETTGTPQIGGQTVIQPPAAPFGRPGALPKAGKP